MNTALLLPIAAGGALGACARYLMSGAVSRFAGVGFPYGTLAVNVLGSLLIGLIAGYFMREGLEAKPAMQAFLITGVLGGFTTFSAFSFEALAMFNRGDTLNAASYVSLSVLLGLGACALGFMLIRTL
ncbi:MAG: fluoride efflux transporter CrcB [Rickettsiales bacterium]|nr:fluoride efflux transporter CrcB [Rickettsiales bacterium]